MNQKNKQLEHYAAMATQLRAEQLAARMLEVLKMSPHVLHEDMPGDRACKCGSCDFVRARDALLAEVKSVQVVHDETIWHLGPIRKTTMSSTHPQMQNLPK